MKLSKAARRAGGAARRGAALMLSVLVLLVLVAIVFQLNIGTGTDARVARNDVGLTMMDHAIESAFLYVYEQLESDGDAAAAGDMGGAGGGLGGDGADPAGGAPDQGGGDQTAVDSLEDEWAQAQPTEINEIQLLIFIQDEDSKYNVLNMLNEDEELAQKAFDRVVRILDRCREDTDEDIELRDAEEMAKAMREYMLDREDFEVPRPTQLTYDEANRNLALPQTLREFLVLEAFEEHHFRDFYDSHDTLVHSLGSFLTVWTSCTTFLEMESQRQSRTPGGQPGSTPGGQGGDLPEGDPDSDPSGGDPGGEPGTGGQGQGQGQGGDNAADGEGQGGEGAAGAAPTGGVAGFAVNLNTSPPAVLKSLMDDRDVDSRFWDRVIEYRNTEQEDEDGEEEENPPLDVDGEEMVPLQIFSAFSEFEDIDGFRNLDADQQSELMALLTLQSNVFSIYVTARRSTASADFEMGALGGGEEDEREQGQSLVRTVRQVVWRSSDGGTVELIPLIRWEVLDYVPFAVEDDPEGIYARRR